MRGGEQPGSGGRGRGSKVNWSWVRVLFLFLFLLFLFLLVLVLLLLLLWRFLWFWWLWRLDQPAILRGVVGPAAAALQAQHVEGHRAMSLAVVTNDLDGWGEKGEEAKKLKENSCQQHGICLFSLFQDPCHSDGGMGTFFPNILQISSQK